MVMVTVTAEVQPLQVSRVDHVDEVGAVDTVDEEFLALVCSDPEWLRAEFDAIVAESWDVPPPDPSRPCGGAGDWQGRVGWHSPLGAVVPAGSPHPWADRTGRTRSPPGTERHSWPSRRTR